MHIRSKFDGGKQINRSQRGSWNGRCAGAGLRCNEGPTWGPTSWEKVTSRSPNDVFKTNSLTLLKQTDNDRKRKSTEQAKQQRKKAKFTTKDDDDVNSRRAYSRHDGTIEVDDVHVDLPVCDLQDLMVQYYRANVMVNESKATSIQLTTMKHSSDSKSLALWIEERRLRVTSSNVGAIARRRTTTKVGPLVNQLLYSNFKGNRATSWGLLQEEDTEKQYQNFMRTNSTQFSVIGDCGLVVSMQHPWLAATPDGFVYDPNENPQNGLVEYKNPHSCRNITIAEGVKMKKIKFLTTSSEDSLILKRSHEYYYQIQTAMLCTSTQWCDFVVRTSVDFQVVERVRVDAAFCESFLDKVRNFYFNSILPELTVKHTPIREPDWITNIEEWNTRITELTYTNK